jgi:photosystem II stability/assembly factor-like uncharacterized protein
MSIKLFSFIFIFLGQNLIAQKIEMLQTNLNNSFRGLSVVNDSLLWVSGTNGTVGKSIDAGKTFQWIKVKGFENADFRDLEAFDDKTAIIMAVGEPATILKTIDGGQNWNKVYENNTKGMFLDAMDFIDSQSGVVVGDPINGKVFMAKTTDGGNHWKEVKPNKLPNLMVGEAFFAASGSNIKMLSKKKNIYVSGGVQSHVFINKNATSIPFITGRESSGANAIAVKNDKNWMIVGGDYTKKDTFEPNVFFTSDAGKTFSKPVVLPRGYRSGLEYIDKNSWIICGLSGVDISNDNGKTWINISQNSFHVVKKAKNGTKIFFAGNNQIGIYNSKNEQKK